MVKKIILIVMLFNFISFSHENGSSRATLFKKEIQATDDQFNKIINIDDRYSIIYKKFQSELQYKNATLLSLIKKKPFNEKEVEKNLKIIANIQVKLKLNTIKHHLEIEEILDSFQRMKFNESFNPF